jgi:thiamine kinase-like enzyme
MPEYIHSIIEIKNEKCVKKYKNLSHSQNEIIFYNDLISSFDEDLVCKCFEFGRDYIVLQNLNTYEQCNRIQGFSLNFILKIIPYIAYLYSFHWESDTMKTKYSFRLWILNESRISDTQLEKMYTQRSKTIVHGDLNAENIFFNEKINKPKFIDWEFFHFGVPALDILTHILNFYSIDIHSFQEIIQLYIDSLAFYKIEYNLKEFLNDLQMCTECFSKLHQYYSCNQMSSYHEKFIEIEKKNLITIQSLIIDVKNKM